MNAVNRTLIDVWVDNNGPDGLVKLALKAGVSSSLLEKTRLGFAPKKAFTRQKICQALGVKEAELFPARNEKAS
ncbi:MAG: hypothetical protein ACXVCP_00465 [Bdellovibrio sp.]